MLLAVWTFVHFGLVTIVAALFVAGVLNLFPMATAASRWYSDTAMFIRLLPLALVLFGFVEAIRRRSHPGAGSA